MGCDTITVLDIGRCKGLDWLVAELEAMPWFTSELESCRPRWPYEEWEVQPGYQGVAKVMGPCGFVLSVRGGILEVYHIMPFRIFTSDFEMRQALRRSIRMLADLVGCPRAICTHELMHYEGTSVNEVEAWMEREVGPPAETYEELQQAEYWGPRAWYIDSFAHLRN